MLLLLLLLLLLLAVVLLPIYLGFLFVSADDGAGVLSTAVLMVFSVMCGPCLLPAWQITRDMACRPRLRYTI